MGFAHAAGQLPGGQPQRVTDRTNSASGCSLPDGFKTHMAEHLIEMLTGESFRCFWVVFRAPFLYGVASHRAPNVR